MASSPSGEQDKRDTFMSVESVHSTKKISHAVAGEGTQSPHGPNSGGGGKRPDGRVKRGYTATKKALEPYKPLSDFLQTWGLLIIHLILTALLTFCVLYWVQGLRVNAGNQRLISSRRMYALGSAIDPREIAYFTSQGWLLPGDITTVVSTLDLVALTHES